MKIGEIRDFGTLPEAQRFGIEVEVEGCTGWDQTLHQWWSTTHDGSLRDHGVEFVSEPLTLARSMNALTALHHDMERRNWVTNARTGIHVHVDMLAREVEEVRRILVAYVCLEPVLFDFCGRGREENIYCVPYYRAAGDLPRIRAFLDNPGAQTMRHLSSTCKYSGLYTEPLYRFGTIEFRGAPTWRSAEKSQLLVNALNNLVVQAVAMDNEGDVLDLFDDAPDEGVSRFMPDLVTPRSADRLVRTNSPGVAEILVRTKLTDEDWQFSKAKQPPMAKGRARKARIPSSGIRFTSHAEHLEALERGNRILRPTAERRPTYILEPGEAVTGGGLGALRDGEVRRRYTGERDPGDIRMHTPSHGWKSRITRGNHDEKYERIMSMTQRELDTTTTPRRRGR